MGINMDLDKDMDIGVRHGPGYLYEQVHEHIHEHKYGHGLKNGHPDMEIIKIKVFDIGLLGYWATAITEKKLNVDVVSGPVIE
jgi:hypothetical protein